VSRQVRFGLDPVAFVNQNEHGTEREPRASDPRQSDGSGAAETKG
jgi:hypothetical protein